MRLHCARTVPIVYVPLVVTTWSDVRIPPAGVPCLVRVVGAMATGGSRGARVTERHIPATREALVPLVEYLVFVEQSLSLPRSAFRRWWCSAAQCWGLISKSWSEPRPAEVSPFTASLLSLEVLIKVTQS